MKKILCIFGHEWFWEGIKIKFDEKGRIWDTLNIKVCTRCGKIKAFVEGHDDNGEFKAINGGLKNGSR